MQIRKQTWPIPGVIRPMRGVIGSRLSHVGLFLIKNLCDSQLGVLIENDHPLLLLGSITNYYRLLQIQAVP